MKNFKKYLLSVLTITSLTLTSCANKNEEKKLSNESTKSQVTSTEKAEENPQDTNVKILINDKVNDKEILTEDAKINKEGLKPYLEKNHQAKFEDGMMTELEGISQDKDEGYYWMYYVNGEMADVGIEDYVPKAGDKIEFRFEKM